MCRPTPAARAPNVFHFRDTNLLCSFGLARLKAQVIYLLRCFFYSTDHNILFDNMKNIVGEFSHLRDDQITNLLLYGKDSLSTEENASVLRFTIDFLKSSEQFDVPLF